LVIINEEFLVKIHFKTNKTVSRVYYKWQVEIPEVIFGFLTLGDCRCD